MRGQDTQRTSPTLRRASREPAVNYAAATGGPPSPRQRLLIARAAGSPPGLAEALDDRRVCHAAAFAHGLQTEAAAAALELVDERRHQPRTRAAERVTQRDRAAVHV